MSKPLKIWIDITNSPHVLFFEPIIKYFNENKINYVVTCRDLGGSKDLLIKKKIPFIELGSHYGKSILKKAIGTISEIKLRLDFLKKHKEINLILTHQSPYAIIAGYLKNKKTIEFFDNEHTKLSNLLSFPLATKLYCPEALKSVNLSKKYFFTKKKINYYPGIKEALYLNNFKKDLNFLKNTNLKEKTYIVFRPEASLAHYHPTNKYTTELIDKLVKDKKIIVLVARYKEQREEYRKKYKEHKNFIILEKAVDGPQLIAHAKQVLSAGGTMNREACVLGVPVISLYSGKLLAVDKWLIKKGYMQHISFGKDNKTKKKLPKLKSLDLNKIVYDMGIK